MIPIKLKLKIPIIVFFIVTAMTALFTNYVIRNQHEILDSQLYKSTELINLYIKSSYASPVWELNLQAINKLNNDLMQIDEVVAFNIRGVVGDKIEHIETYFKMEDSDGFKIIQSNSEYINFSNDPIIIHHSDEIYYNEILVGEYDIFFTHNLIELKIRNAIINLLLISIFFIIVTIATLSIVLNKFLIIPIISLAGFSINYGKGKTNSSELLLKRNDEIGTLYKSINHMLTDLDINDQLNKKINDELQHERSVLEDKVKIRTADLEQVNRQLIEAKEIAENATKTKSVFLSNVTHELRTPMNSILGFSEILFKKEENPKKIAYISSILENGKILLQLINDILDLSKVEEGRLELEYSQVSITTFFDEMRLLFDSNKKEKELDFTFSTKPEMPEYLILDKVRIKQILVNLISNSFKFTDSGFIKVSADYIYHDNTNCSTIDLIFTVADSGKGIPDDQVSYIFGQFNQALGQKHSEYGGSGLGLSIIKNLLGLLNGEISVESELGVGSIFTVIIKRVQVASNESSVEMQNNRIDSDLVDFNNQKVLVVDDNAYNRELIESYLEDNNVQVDECINGLDALEQIKKNYPDLILLDMKMPVMDGYEVSSIMKHDEKLKDIPIIAVTASVLHQDEERIKMHCDGFLRKPVSRDDLIREMIKYISCKTQNVEKTISNPAQEKKHQPLTIDALNKSPEIKQLLLERVQDIKLYHSQMRIRDICDIADELIELSNLKGETSLIIWLDNMSNHANNFQIEIVKKDLKLLLELLEV